MGGVSAFQLVEVSQRFVQARRVHEGSVLEDRGTESTLRKSDLSACPCVFESHDFREEPQGSVVLVYEQFLVRGVAAIGWVLDDEFRASAGSLPR